MTKHDTKYMLAGKSFSDKATVLFVTQFLALIQYFFVRTVIKLQVFVPYRKTEAAFLVSCIFSSCDSLAEVDGSKY